MAKSLRKPLALLLGGAALLATSPLAAQTLDLNGGTENHTSLLGYTIVENGILNLTPAASFTFAGVLQDGAGTLMLNKLGLNSLTLTGLNTFSGETRITTGTLFAGAVNTLSANSRARVNSALQLQGFDQTIKGFYGSGLIQNLTGGQVVLTTANAAGVTSAFSGTILETVGNEIKLVKTGTGTQNLTGVNSYSGGIEISGGTLAYGNTGSLGSGRVTFTGAGTLSSIANSTILENDITLASDGRFAGGASTLNGLIDGSGALIKLGGPLTITNPNNSYSGGTQLFGNILVLGGDNVLGSGTLTFVTGSKLSTLGNDTLLSNAIQLDAQMFIDLPTGKTLDLRGVISGSKGMYIAGGPGTLLLSGANDFGGTTYLTSGTLGVGTNTALGSSLLRVSAATTLKAYAPVTLGNSVRIDNAVLTVDTDAFAVTLNGPVRDVSATQTGALVKTGSGTLTLGVANTYSGGTILKDGTVSVANDNRLGNVAGALVFDGGNLRVTGTSFNSTNRAIQLLGNGAITIGNSLNTFVLTQAITGGGGLTKLGNGALALNAANLFGGGVILDGGVMIVGSNDALGSGVLTMTSGTLVTGVSALDLGNDVVLGAAAFDTDGNQLTLSGDLSGGGVLAKIGAGVLILNGSNSYTGGSTIDEGDVYIGANGALGTGTATFAANTNLTATVDATLDNSLTLSGAIVVDDGGHAFTLNSVIDGSGPVTKRGSGTVALNGGNSFTGGIDLEGGTILVGNDTALGAASGTLTMHAGTTLKANSGIQLANQIDLDGDATIESSGTSLSLNGVVGGTGILTKTGVGSLFLGASNTYSNGTLLNQGGIEFDHGDAFGTGAITMADDTALSSDGSNTLANGIVLLGRARINSNGPLLTLDGEISGALGRVEFSGSTIALGVNSYGGGTSVDDVVIQLGDDASFGTGTVSLLANASLQNVSGSTRSLGNVFTLDAAGIVVGGSDDIELSQIITGGFGFTKTGANTLTLAAANSYLGDTHLDAGRIIIEDGGAFGAGKLVVGTGTLQFGTTVRAMTLGSDIDIAGALTLDFVASGAAVDPVTGAYVADGSTVVLNHLVSGTGGLVLANSGDVTIAHANTYAGGTSINESVVRILDNAAFGIGTITAGVTAGLRNDSGTAYTLANAVVLNSSDATIGGSGALTLAGVVTGVGGFEKVGSGTLTLGNDNSYAGLTSVRQGGLDIAGANVADITVGSGATLSGLGSTTGTVTILDGGILSPTNGPAVLTFGNLVLNDHAITNFQLGAPGGTNARVEVTSDLTLGGVINIAALPGFTLGTYRLINYGGVLTNRTAILGTIPIAYAAGDLMLDWSTFGRVDLIVNSGGILYWDGTGPHGDGTLDGGSGTWNIGNTNWTNTAFTGITAWANTTGVFGGTTAGTVAVASTLGFDMLYFTTDSYVLSDAGGELTPNTTGEIKLDGNVLATIDARITGANGLVKSGDGTLVLGGANTFAGDFDIAQGIVGIGNNKALGNGDVTLASGASLQARGTFVVANTITMTGASAIDSNGSTLTLSGVLQGDALHKIGAGTLVLSGLNDYSGGTFLKGGDLSVRADANLGNGAGAVTFASTTAGSFIATAGFTTTRDLIVTNANTSFVTGAGLSVVWGGTVSGAGSLVKSGAGTLVLNQANSQAETVIADGTLAINDDAALGAGSLTFAGIGNGILRADAALIISREIVLTSSGSIDTAHLVTLDGNLTGSGGLTKLGTGTLAVNQGNSYLGDTNLADGTLDIGATDALGAGTLVFSDLTTLQTSGNFGLGNAVTTAGTSIVDTIGTASRLALGGSIGGSGDLQKTGAGTLTLSGTNSYHDTLLQAGTIAVASDGALGSGVLVFTGGTTLQAAATVHLANDVTTAGIDTIDTGSNTLVLEGIVGGAGSLTKSGTGNLTIGKAGTAANSYADTVLDQGSITVAKSSALGSGTLTMNNVTSLIASGAAALTLGNAVQLDGTATIDAGTSGLVLGGKILGSALTKTGTGTLTLNNALNAYAGTSVSDGTLRLGANAAAGANAITFVAGLSTALQFGVTGLDIANAIVLNGTTTVALGGFNSTLSGIISGHDLNASGAGTLHLTNILNAYAATNISGGARVETTSNAALGTTAGAVSFLGTVGGTLALNGVIASDRAINLTASGTVDTMTDDDTLSGIVSGAGKLFKSGAGGLTLSGINTYTGGTDILAGAVRVINDKSLGDGDVTTYANTTLVVGGVALDIGNGIDLAGATTVELEGRTTTLSGIIGGAGALSIQNGKLYLAGANVHSGGTNVLNGTVVATNTQSFGIGAVNLNGGGTLLGDGPLVLTNAVVLTGTGNQIGTADSLTLTNAITGSGGFTKDGAGVLDLSGISTYAGDTTVAFGGLAVNGALTGAGIVTVSSGATLSGAGTIAGNVIVADGGHFAPGNSPGTITVGGLALGSDSFLDFDLGEANVSGGTFNDHIVVTHDLTLNGHLTVTDSNSFSTGVYNLISYGGALSGSGLMIDSLPLTFGGVIQTLVAGQVNLIVTQPGVLLQYWDGSDMAGDGSIGGGAGSWGASNTNWTTAAPSTLNASWQGGLASFGGSASGTVTITGSQAIHDLQFTTTGYVLAAGVGGALDTSVASFVATGTGVTATIDAPITGTGSLAKQGLGTLTLTGTSTYAGGTTLTAGTLIVGGDSALGTGVLTLGGGSTLGSTGTVAYLMNAIHTSALGTVDTIDVLSGSDLQLDGVISGNAQLKKTGDGTLTLFKANSYAGGTDVTQGGVQIRNGGSLGTGQLKLAANTYLGADADDLVVANAIDLTGNVLVNQSATTLTLDGDIGGTGDLVTSNPGTLILNGDNSFHTLYVLHGAVELGTDTAAGGGSIYMGNDSLLSAGVSGLVIANAISLNGPNRIDSGTGTLTLTGSIDGGLLDKRGASELVLNAVNTYTGGTTLTAGTITVANDEALGSGALTFTGGTTLKAGADVILANDIVTADIDTIATGVYTMTLNGAVSGTGSIVKTGGSTLVLNGANGYINGTSLTDGTIVVGSDTALGAGALTMANSTTLRAGVDNLVLANAITLTGGDTIDAASFGLTLDGVIDGSGTLQTAGHNRLTLNGANSYTGGTELNSTLLAIGHETALGTGQLTINGFAVLRAGVDNLVVANGITTNDVSTLDAQNLTFTLDGVIDGAGQINTGGNGTLVLNGANSYTGGTTHSGGTLVVGNDTALGLGTVDLFADSRLVAGATNLTLANRFDLILVDESAAVIIDTRATTLTLSGLVTGDSPLAKLGAGNLVLTGNNDFTGGTNLAEGMITIGADTALGTGALTLADGTTLQAGTTGLVVANDIVTAGLGTIATQAYDLTLGGAITGAGGITKTGTGTLTLGGTSTYTGATALNEGKTLVDGMLGLTAVTVASGATLGGHGLIAGSVNIADGGILAAGNSPGTLTFGSLTLHDTSLVQLDLAEVNTIGGLYNDLTVVLGDLTLDGKLTVAPSLTFGNGIYELFSYGGALTDHGLDIVSLPGTSAGVVETLVSGQVNLLVTAPGTLVQYWDGADGIGNGVISGGTGTWSTFATNWTEPSPSELNGSWQGGIARFQGTAGVVTLDTAESFQGLAFAIDGYSVKATGSGGLVTNSNAFIFVANGATTDISAPIGGTGSFRKLGNGTLNLSGASTYTGGTDLRFGTLGVGSNTALGTGLLTIQHATTLAATVTGLTLANAITTVGSADVDSGAGVFTLAGNIGGAGSIEKIGSGNLVLNGANSFTNLAVLSGTVTLGTNTAAGIGTVDLIGGTTLAAGVSGLVVANSVAVSGGAVAIDSTKGSFTLAGPVTGNGSLASTGTLVLNGANSFNGLAIAAGSVTLGTDTAAGSGIVAMAAGTRLAAGVTGLVVANAIITAGVGQLDSGAGLLTLGGNIGGAGSIAKVGTGTLRLNGTNSFASAAINSGTLAIGSAGALGTGRLTVNTGTTLQAAVTGLVFANAVTLVGATTVDTQALALSLTGIIGGSGSMAKIGSGALTLSAANTYTGGTGLAAGTLAVANAAALGTGALTITAGTLQAGVAGLTLANAVVTSGAGSVDTQAFALTLSGATSGAAALTKTGSGTLFLTGASTRTGTTTIAAGTLNSAVAGLGSGNVVDNGALVFNQAVDASYASVISGTGTVAKIGAGNLTLTGVNTVSGATSLTGGRLTVAGALSASTVTAATGTTLAGTGSIAGLVAASGSVVSPGAVDLATGTLTVSGNASFQAGSTLLVNVLPTTADRVTIGGTANLAGNLVLTATTGQYLFNTSYTLLSAAGGRTGTFVAPALTLFGPAFAPTLTYGANDLVLKLVPNSLVALLGTGPNSANVLARATAFDRATTAGFNPQAFYNLYLQGAGLGAALNQLTGEIHSADSRQALTDTRHVREAALDRLGAGTGSNGGNDASSRAAGETGIAGWGRAVGSWGNTDSDGNGAKLDIDTKGVLVGIDIASGTWKAGALFNALESKVDTRILGTSKVKTTGGGIYGGYRSGQGFSLAVGASVGSVKTHSSRAITVPGLTQVLTGHTSGTSYQVFGDIAYDLAAAEKTRVEPFVRFAYVAYHVDGLAESGGFAGLVSGKQKYDATFTTVGLRASTEIGKTASLRGSLGYQYTGGDRAPIASLSIQGTNQNAGIRSVALDKSAFAGEAGVDVHIGKNSSLGVGYTGVIGKNNSDNGVKATLSVGF
ncbi:autotransporter-associated beta strand repeat-containing protein [Glacieibacterium sp.]|uniref:autotransporter-associated beta strand repeat-containing protein n=1 Tax=Glacieibacterium sp. TaxID=2860237 RepID=UPI003AFF7E3D